MATNPTPNILHLFLDELRADALGCYDHPFVETPALDALAARGIQFDEAYADCPLCVPQRTSLMTSMYPHQTGVTFNNADPLDSDAVADAIELFDRLREAGYERCVNLGKFHLNGIEPAAAGFDEHVPVQDGLGASHSTCPTGVEESDVLRIPGAPNTILAGVHPETRETLSARLVDETLAQIDQAQEPWYIRVSLNRPHTPVMPPEPYASRYMNEVTQPEFDSADLDDRPAVLRRWRHHRGFEQFSAAELTRIRAHYFGLVSFIDQQLGRIFTALEQEGDLADTLIVFHSDHGSSIGDNGMQVKGPYDSPDIANVPFIVSWPAKLPEGRTYHGLVQLLDLHPTLLDLLDLAIPSHYEGTPLTPALRNRDGPINDEVFAEGTWPPVHQGYRQTIRTPRWRLTRYAALGEVELIDRESNPSNNDNVAETHPGVVAGLADSLDTWAQETPPMTLRESTP